MTPFDTVKKLLKSDIYGSIATISNKPLNMKIRLLLLSITLFSFIGTANAQVTISQCATPGSIQAAANCQIALPDFTSQIIAEDPTNPDPISVNQAPVPGTMVSPGDITLTFNAFSNFGADTCMAILTVTGNPTTCGTYVPDDNFEQALIDLGYDTAPLNNFVPTENIAALTSLDVSNKSITDLTGIEAFVALTQLDVNDNQLTFLDVSNNIALQTLNCHNNTAIEYLDLRNNTALTSLRCDNVGLKSLDFRNGNNTNVVSFQADNNNMRCIAIDDQFGAYTASWIKDGSTSYFYTVCEIYIPGDNFEQALIDMRYDVGVPDNFVSGFALDTLRKLDLSNRNINDLTGADYFASMEDFNISNNNISEFDFQYNTKLKKLDASSNGLNTIDLSTSSLLEELYLSENQLTSLDVSTNGNLEILDISQNNLSGNSAVILGSNTIFDSLDVSDNDLSDIDLSGVPNLTELLCSNNMLSNLDLSIVTNLTELEYTNNGLSDFDASKFPLLEVLYLNDNNLTTLDVSGNPVLGLLRVNNNDLSFLNIKNGNNVNFVEFNASNNPNLGCIQVDNAADAYAGGGNYSGWQIDGATSSYADQCLTLVPDDNFEQALIDAGYDTTGLDNFVPTANIASVVSFNAGTGGALYNKGITDLTGIEDFVSLIQLWSDGNPLVSIDLSKNTALNTMALIGTALTDLDLSGNTQLFFAVVRDNNQLTSINLSANTLLTNLTIGNNLLSAIDLSTNTALTKLNINNSSLSSIDLSANVRLDRIFIKDTPLSSLDLNTNTALANLELNATALTSIDLSTNTALSQLIVNNSSLTSLDLSANTVLDYLECTNNLLSNLDLSNNVLLEELYLSDNELTSIDLSTNTALNYLYCNDNSLTGLDLSANPAMEELEANNNQLTSLNVKNGANASDFYYVSVINNPDLSCIEVDDEVAANAGAGNYSGWNKDATTLYAENCQPCEFYNNFEIQSVSETCIDKHNGSILINSNESLAYSTQINGEVYTFTESLEVSDLAPGIYPFCITANGDSDCEQCFEVVIKGAEKLAGKTTVSSKELFVEMDAGTAPYIVMINNKEAGSFTSNNFAVDVQHGDEVEVFSSLDCEGKLSAKVDLFKEITISPNPTVGDITLTLPATVLKTIHIDIHNTLGGIISSGVYDATTGRIVIPTEVLPQGIYFISIDKGTTFKIVKQ